MKRKVFLFLGTFLLVLNLFLLHIVLAYGNTSYVHQTNNIIQNYTPTNASYPNKEIIISLSQEQLTAYDGPAIFLQTPVTTGGQDTPTPVGTYEVIQKLQNFVMHSPWPQGDWRWYPDSSIRYGLLFQKDGYFIHDASWRDNFGPGSNTALGTPGGSFTGSHGCVNVPLDAEAALYAWATIGTAVIIQQ